PEESGAFAFTVIAMDAFEQVGERSYSLQIAPPTITLEPVALPDGIVGEDYHQVITASGGNAPYTFALDSGSLPAGLHLDSDGTLGGTLTSAGSLLFVILAIDNYNQTGMRAYSVTVTGAVVTISPATIPPAQVGTAYTQALSASGGTAPYAFEITGGSLPPGMTLDADGLIDGTPEAPGSFDFTAKATDAHGQAG